MNVNISAIKNTLTAGNKFGIDRSDIWKQYYTIGATLTRLQQATKEHATIANMRHVAYLSAMAMDIMSAADDHNATDKLIATYRNTRAIHAIKSLFGKSQNEEESNEDI